MLVCIVSLAAGFLGGMLGMAAGIFIVPALTLMFGLDIRHAVGASLVSVIGAKILMRTSNERIRALFIVVLLALAAKMFMTALQGRHLAGGI